jgi:SAM-dependent methyltransferase
MADGPPRIFDRHAVTLRRLRAQQIAADKFLVKQAAEGLSARLQAVRRTFESGIDLDGSETSFTIIRPHASEWSRIPLQSDETLVFEPHGFDLATSVLSLHAVNDLPGVLVQIARALKPDGLFVAALFGGDTLFELKQSLAAAEMETRGGISPRVAPFADVRDLGGLLQRAGFALPVADVERTVVRYRNPWTLFADLRAMGETNVLVERDRKPLPRQTLAAALAHYASKHADPDGRLRATFDVAYLTGWSPHESQPKALKPGSAAARLADALHTTEQSAGEKVPNR